MEVFLDIIILENIVMNYLILLTTSKFIRSKVSNFRLLVGAIIGAAYVVLMVVLPGIKALYTVFARILLSCVIVAVAFSPKKFNSFFKTLAIFYVCTFIFAGAAFAFLYFNQNGGFIRNGIIYVFWRSKWTVLFLSIVMGAIIVRIFWDILQYRLVKEKLLNQLKIAFENKAIELSALVDTGNSLHDPLTNMPVVVVEFDAIKEILPADIRSIFNESRENDLVTITGIISSSQWFSRFRLIPYTSLGKENGMLIGFKPDYIEISDSNEERKGISDVIIGIYNKALSKNEKYKALLNPELI
ncbi:MAG TPA: sigma-E processing peptidase SpoIIGA [Clostridiaceae bacterium]|nr:sigma-E processing peptidase SpoIIGA [Clostridiaceae bacterium]